MRNESPGRQVRYNQSHDGALTGNGNLSLWSTSVSPRGTPETQAQTDKVEVRIHSTRDGKNT